MLNSVWMYLWTSGDWIISFMSKTNSILSKNPSSQGGSEPSSKEDLMSIKMRNKWKILTQLMCRLYNNRMASSWERIKLIPYKWLKIQERMKRTVQNVFKKQDYLSKWESFQKVRKVAIVAEQKEVQHLKQTLQKQRGTAIRLLTAFVMGKRKINFQLMMKKLKEVGDWKVFQMNTNHRTAIRTISRVVNRKIQQSFSRLKSTRVIIQYVKRCRNLFRIVKDIKARNTKAAFLSLRREMLRNKREKVGQEIKELDEKLGAGEDEEMKGLKDKHQEYIDQLQQIRKEREEITAGFQAEVKEAEAKNKEMKQTLEGLKTKQEEMKKRVLQIDEELKVPYSLEEIYQLCYQNLLWYISQNNEKTYSKEELLKSLQTPLVPIDLPLDQLKEENTVLRELLSEYVLMYGEKKLPENTKLELPYEYLLKENNILYKMLMTLLPNVQFLKDQIHRIRESFEGVQSSLKEMSYK